MSRALIVREAGPGVTVQDLGRPGWLAQGVSRGGAADRLALLEGAALLDQTAGCAALEMAGFGGAFEVTEPVRIALTGAPMAARSGARRLEWNAAHQLEPGARLTVGGVRAGVYGYLHVGGGIGTEPVMGSRSAHLAARIGGRVAADDRLPVGPDAAAAAPARLDVADRFGGGEVRLLPVPQTELFAEAERRRFCTTVFTRDPRGNRQGVRLSFDGAPFVGAAGLGLVSEVVQPGDVQLTGDGAPYVLLAECQTTGGYPRIGTVLPCDLPRVAQAAPGTALRFRLVGVAEALAVCGAEEDTLRDLRRRLRPIVRAAEDIADLLGYQLVSGVTAGEDTP